MYVPKTLAARQIAYNCSFCDFHRNEARAFQGTSHRRCWGRAAQGQLAERAPPWGECHASIYCTLKAGGERDRSAATQLKRHAPNPLTNPLIAPEPHSCSVPASVGSENPGRRELRSLALGWPVRPQTML